MAAKYLIPLAILLASTSAVADTVLFTGVDYDFDGGAVECWRSDRSGDLHAVGAVGVRQDLYATARWAIAVVARHRSCLAASDTNPTNAVGIRLIWRLR